VERTTPTAVLATKTPTEEVPGTTEPIAVSATPAREQPPYVEEPAEATQPEFGEVGYVPPKKDRTKLVVGGLVILIPVAVGAFLLSQRGGSGPSNVAAPPAIAAGVVGD